MPKQNEKTATFGTEAELLGDLKLEIQKPLLALRGKGLNQEIFQEEPFFSDIGSHDSEVADLDETKRQDMLEKSSNKLQDLQATGFGFLRFTVFIRKGDLSILQLYEFVIGNGDPIDIGRYILDNFLSRSGGLTMDNPIFLPDLLGNLGIEICFFKRLLK